ncbi:MAG: histidine phosphatase family protein [Gammaproteobacteria bacterium]|nr:histidine phosphatase family protein [Gammaproteobacteria bacterium]
MKLILIRHGEPDYSKVLERGHIGMGVDLAELSERGIAQAEEASHDERLKGAEVIISSPYTRALETAAIISKNTGLDIIIENDLHEWSCDLTYKRKRIDFHLIHKEMLERNGVWDKTCKYKWEEFLAVGNRAFGCLKKYIGKYDKVIVVAHGFVFNQFIFNPRLHHCEIQEYEFNEDSKPLGYIYPFNNKENSNE